MLGTSFLCLFVYTSCHPERGTELIQYNHIIQTASGSYLWDNVYQYDREFRRHMERHPGRNWGIILQQAWTMFLKDRANSTTPSKNWNGECRVVHPSLLQCTNCASLSIREIAGLGVGANLIINVVFVVNSVMDCSIAGRQQQWKVKRKKKPRLLRQHPGLILNLVDFAIIWLGST